MRINTRLILTVLISFVDDIIIVILALWVLSLFGIQTSRWLVGLLVLGLCTWGLIAYWALLKNPTLGFENVVGKTGLAVEPIKRKGTVRIGHELWQASARENIEQGVEIRVVNQTGLKLTVVKK